ncbi:hypothetical protein AOLI_G00031050 [Acnodon oligacanthus]
MLRTAAVEVHRIHFHFFSNANSPPTDSAHFLVKGELASEHKEWAQPVVGRQWRVLSTRGSIILKRQWRRVLVCLHPWQGVRSSCFPFDQRVGHVSWTRDCIRQRNCCEGDP